MTIERTGPLAAQTLDRTNETTVRVVPDERTQSDVVELVKALLLEVTQLKVARDSNRRIGMAMGIVMTQLHVDEPLAFDALRRISQNTNRKLRDVAEDVIRDRHI
jgi:AmiR/NasT family two-component response regulator